MRLNTVVIHGITSRVLSVDVLALLWRRARLLNRVHLGSAGILLCASRIDFVLILELLLTSDEMRARVRLKLLFRGKAIYIMTTAANRALESAWEIVQTLTSSNDAGKDRVLLCEVTREPGSKASRRAGRGSSKLLVGIDACARSDSVRCADV